MLPRVFPPPFPSAADDSVAIPDTRSPRRFLISLLWQQRALLAATAAVVVLWQVPSALLPWLLGRAIDAGVVAHDVVATVVWAALLLLMVVIGVVGGITSHTAAVSGWLVAMYRTTALTVRQSLRLGHVLGRRTPTGELLSVSSSDADTFGACAVNLPTAFGALVALATTVAVVMPLNWRMGLVVLLAAPVMVFGAAPLLRPLGEARSLERNRSSTLTGQATDIVAGLRILRGIGGEKTFGDNYARQSQTVKQASLSAAAWQAAVDALAIALSGLVIVLLTWLGVAEMDAGRLDVGGLVTFFGYAVFLTGPVQTLFVFTQRWVQGLVSAAKTIGVLEQAAPWPRPADPQPWPEHGVIEDKASGFVAQPGQFTVVVSATPDDSAALADRLGRYLPSDAAQRAPELDQELKGRARRKDAAEKASLRAEIAAADAERARQPWGVTVGGVDLALLPIDEVRSHIHVSDANATLFAGTVQDALDPWHRATRQQAEAALVTSSALDVFESLPEGWATHLDERGRGLSGGQRQRLVLARALLADPEVLVLVEPTSAVDAHTEAQIASRLVEARAGRTTVVTSASPLLLRHADSVVLLDAGRTVAHGTHAQLMASNPAYRAIVTRGEQEQA